jgi:hypothetical protein
MRNQIFKISSVVVMAIASFLMQSRIASAQASETMTIQNESAFDIRQIFLSKVSHRTWEEDVLGRRILRSGRSIDVTNIDPDFYDVMLVDEDGDTCVLYGVNLRRNRTWTINTEGLLDCEFR